MQRQIYPQWEESTHNGMSLSGRGLCTTSGIDLQWEVSTSSGRSHNSVGGVCLGRAYAQQVEPISGGRCLHPEGGIKTQWEESMHRAI